MKLGKFHSPYLPNDGHGPGVPLPENLHRWLCTLAGGTWPVRLVVESVSEMTHDEDDAFLAEDHGDYIRISQGVWHEEEQQYRITRHWLGIKYDEVKDEAAG